MSTPTATAPSIRPLRDNELACASCGIAVAGPHDPAEHVVATSLGREGAVLQAEKNYGHALTFTRCPTCRAIHGTAVELLNAFPAESARIGAREIAVHRLELALDALDALGITNAQQIDTLAGTGLGIRRLIEYLAVAGGSARFLALFAPRRTSGVKLGTAASTRWGHLDDDTRATLRAAGARLMQARVQRPVPVLCPPDDDGSPSGCMMCGVGAVKALPSLADRVWTERSATSQALGGRPSVERVYGAVCPPCERAVQRVGAIGLDAVERAVLVRLGRSEIVASTERLDGLVAWAVTSNPPSDTPWDHVNLSALLPA